ncbi:MAG: MBOAT family protein [Candidatus Hydrogenedentes bacterium]|nr:MBOAT family protein [Candidatus Hydrogenedentota bacterium]
MLFNSLTFIVFFIIVMGLYRAPISWRMKKQMLLVASYIFYAAWNPPFILLLWFSTMVDWEVARRLDRTDAPGMRRVLLGISLAANLGLLGFFKYATFALENFTALTDLLGIPFHPAAPGILLPVGISFYTFQTLSYTLDVYRRTMKPIGSFLDYALFVTYFPQLVAGPIVRPSELVPQFQQPPRVTLQDYCWGLFLITLGLFQKVVLADGPFAFTADMVFRAQDPLNMLDAWAGALAFAGQIFCDFAGYSTCAIGISRCMGFHLCPNFNAPYAAVGFSDFWRRWHISLSTWLRDYLYITLGGNRISATRTQVNLMITMMLGGLWHGASWNFVIWGTLHGAYLIVERLLRAGFANQAWTGHRIVRIALGALTLALVTIAWVFFRAQDLPTAMRLVTSMLGMQPGGVKLLATIDIQNVFMPLAVLVALQCWLRNKDFRSVVSGWPWWLTGSLWALMAIVLILMQGVSGAFIYFQF